MDMNKNVIRFVVCQRILLSCVAGLIWVSTSVAQQPPTVVDYFNAYLEAREATIQGVRARLTLLKRGAAADATFNALDQQTQDEVHVAYDKYGFTPLSHLEYGTAQQGAIDRWLDREVSVQQLLDQQQDTLDSLSEQIRAVQEEG